MVSSFTVSVDESYAELRIVGKIYIAQILSLQSLLYHQIEYLEHMKSLWDFTEATIAEGASEVMKLAIKSMNNRPLNIAQAKIAFVVGTNYRIRAFAETYHLAVASEEHEIQIFETKEEATDWFAQLDRPVI